ncbi:MAG: YihY/virulence factor BrkB family protein [bacterium]
MVKLSYYLASARQSLGYYASGLYNRLGDHHVFLLASGMAFTMLVCIMPLMAILFAFLGVILERPAIMSEIHLFVERVVPYPDAARFVMEFIERRVGEFSAYKNVMGILGSVGLIFASTGLFSSMRTILGVVYHPDKDESILHGKMRDFIFVLLVMLYFVVVITAGPIFKTVTGFADPVGWLSRFHYENLQRLGMELISFVLIGVGFFVVYFAVPHKRPPKKSILFSAFWAALLWHVAVQAFGYYITHFVTIRRVYGTYALLIAIAFWSYYTSIVFIVGAEIGQLFRERFEKRPPSAIRHRGPSKFFRE